MNCRRNCCKSPAGYTLLETVLALTLIPLLIAAISTSITLISKTQIQDEGLMHDRFQSLKIAHEISSEVTNALKIAEFDDHVIEFTVTDRDHDVEQTDERLRYAWSGVPGDPLTFQMNDEDQEVLAENVHKFDLQFATVSPGSETTVLFGHDSAPRGHFHDQSIKREDWVAECFVPQFPAGTTSWNIERVRIKAKAHKNRDGVMFVRVGKASSSLLPTTEVWEEALVSEGNLDQNYAWVDVAFRNLTNLNPSQPVSVVLGHAGGRDTVAKVQSNHKGEDITPHGGWTRTDDAGDSWKDISSDRDLQLYIYGTYDTQVEGRWLLSAIQMTIQVGANDLARVDTASPVLTAPELEL